MATPAAITYSPLRCPICLSDPSDFTPDVPHTWHGHAVTTNPAKPNEKIIHGICKACFPTVPAASRSKCPTCRRVFSSGAPEKFIVKPDGTLDSTAPITGEETEETEDERSPLRRRAVTALQITTATDGVDLVPGTTDTQTNTPMWKKIVVRTSIALVPAGFIALIIVSVVCPPAVAITGPIVLFTSVSAMVTATAVECTTSNSMPRGSGRYSPSSPMSVGS